MNKAAYERYQQFQCYKGMKNNVAILLKRLFERYGVKTSEKANMHNEHLLTSTRFSLCTGDELIKGIHESSRL